MPHIEVLWLRIVLFLTFLNIFRASKKFVVNPRKLSFQRGGCRALIFSSEPVVTVSVQARYCFCKQQAFRQRSATEPVTR